MYLQSTFSLCLHMISNLLIPAFILICIFVPKYLYSLYDLNEAFRIVKTRQIAPHIKTKPLKLEAGLTKTQRLFFADAQS